MCSQQKFSYTILTCKRDPSGKPPPVGVDVRDWLVDASPSRAGAVGGALVLLAPPIDACRRDPDAVANPRLRG